MTLTGLNRRSWKETYFNTTLSTSHSTGTGLMLNLDQGDMPMANHLSHGTDWGDVKGAKVTQLLILETNSMKEKNLGG
jgi:hypothetical protein